ncbi:hypothetical protein AD37_0376 [Escherichia coli 1-110-08_S4_C3]|nr:hypothetical protein AD37_1918 [Escherichia coli 1-110-08_S4_C3]EYE05583.1 hypothetical protein AD37_0376 [Escherichia coli 1-110-08_S4_C3]EZJ24848.1 hypothetical protein AD38_1956 [Escherichia coli 1-176-05_S4_C3]KDT57688.1 hypothetical protein AC05_4907 [Escherichia coli 3-267-03_S3_C1]
MRGFRRSKLFSLPTILQKNAIAKTKVQFAAGDAANLLI